MWILNCLWVESKDFHFLLKAKKSFSLEYYLYQSAESCWEHSTQIVKISVLADFLNLSLGAKVLCLVQTRVKPWSKFSFFDAVLWCCWYYYRILPKQQKLMIVVPNMLRSHLLATFQQSMRSFGLKLFSQLVLTESSPLGCLRWIGQP